MHGSGLLDALITLFELVWAQSFDVVPSAAGIRELASARIDETDARPHAPHGRVDRSGRRWQLGMSLRTVQRRVSHLMELAGVLARFQLGHAAGRRGWLGT